MLECQALGLPDFLCKSLLGIATVHFISTSRPTITLYLEQKKQTFVSFEGGVSKSRNSVIVF